MRLREWRFYEHYGHLSRYQPVQDDNKAVNQGENGADQANHSGTIATDELHASSSLSPADSSVTHKCDVDTGD